MESTKILYTVRATKPVSVSTAAKQLKAFQAKIVTDSESYTQNHFTVSGDIADKLAIVAEELAELANFVPVVVTKRNKRSVEETPVSSKKKKRAADDALIGSADKQDAVANSSSASKHPKKKSKTT